MDAPAQYAIITGGESSIGTVLARTLRDCFWMVDAPGKDQCDVMYPEAIQAFFKNRPVDLLVCAAGLTRDSPLMKLGEDSWDHVWQVNFGGACLCARAALPAMITAGAGHIVFISSFSALHPPIGQAAYASAKAALLGLTADLASRYGPQNIRVNAILPGFLETKMTVALSGRRRQEILEQHVLGRFNTCSQVAAFIRFLHEELPHTSGQVFQLDSRVNFP